MEEALRARLLASSGVSALVSTNIVWIERPQGSALPAITLQRITSGREYTYGGASGTSNPIVQVDCWGRSYGEAKAVSRAVISALEPAITQGGVRFGPSFVDSNRDMPSEELPGGVKVFRVSLDFRIWNSPA